MLWSEVALLIRHIFRCYDGFHYDYYIWCQTSEENTVDGFSRPISWLTWYHDLLDVQRICSWAVHSNPNVPDHRGVPVSAAGSPWHAGCSSQWATWWGSTGDIEAWLCLLNWMGKASPESNLDTFTTWIITWYKLEVQKNRKAKPDSRPALHEIWWESLRPASTFQAPHEARQPIHNTLWSQLPNPGLFVRVPSKARPGLSLEPGRSDGPELRISNKPLTINMGTPQTKWNYATSFGPACI